MERISLDWHHNSALLSPILFNEGDGDTDQQKSMIELFKILVRMSVREVNGVNIWSFFYHCLYLRIENNFPVFRICHLIMLARWHFKTRRKTLGKTTFITVSLRKLYRRLWKSWFRAQRMTLSWFLTKTALPEKWLFIQGSNPLKWETDFSDSETKVNSSRGRILEIHPGATWKKKKKSLFISRQRFEISSSAFRQDSRWKKSKTLLWFLPQSYFSLRSDFAAPISTP